MNTICRACIKKAAKWTSLKTKIEKTSSLSFLDFLNKYMSLNACETDKLPQSLCSICTHSIKTFYSFVKLTKKSDTILRETLENSIATERHNENEEISFEEITIKSEEIEEESEDFNKEDSFHCQARQNSTGPSLYILDIVKEEPRVSESTSIVNFKDAEINESDKVPTSLDHLDGSVEEPDRVLSCTDGDLVSIDAEHSDSEDDVPIIFRKRRLIKNKNETDSQNNFLSKAHCINSNLKKKTGKIKVKNKEVLVTKEEDPHSRRSSDGLIWDICQREFKTKIKYENHVRIRHGSRKQVSSEARDDSSKPHIRRHTENTYKYIESDMLFNERKEFRTRHRNHINGNKQECNICGKEFSRSALLRSHLLSHDETKKYKCLICRKSYKHSSTLRNHIIMHSGEKPFECEICGNKFGRKDVYNKHLGTHTHDKKYNCKECSKKFSSKHYLNIHMENHKGITNKCDQCDKKYNNSLTLRNHMKLH